MKVTRQQLLGHVFSAVVGLKPLGELPGSTSIDVVLALPTNNTASQAALLRDLYDPASSRFRQFLSPAEYSAQFDPAKESFQHLLDFAEAHQLNVTSSRPPKLIHVRSSADAVSKAFKTKLQQYQHPTENRRFYAPAADVDISALNIPGLQLTGLDNFHGLQRAPNLFKSSGDNSTASSRRSAGTGSGSNGLYTGKDFRGAYAPDVIWTGSGQVVGVLEFTGYLTSDIQTYTSQNGLPSVPIQNVYIDGYVGSNPNEESAADIELVISMAPGLSQVTVYGVDYTSAGVIDILHEMASPTHGEPLPRQITTSYYFFYDQNVYDALARLAAQGQALFVASGDYGSYNEATGSGAFPPADHPLVTSVGGTELVTTGPGGSWVSETTAWFSGGGYSPWAGGDAQFVIPWWQDSLDYTASGGSSTARNAPDVAIVADGISVYSQGAWVGFAGTSAAAPLWAGFLALANQQAAATGRPPVGFANPALWEIAKGGGSPGYAAAFHDVTTGNNFNGVNPSKYSAVVGYDLCTGWGSPKGQALVDALARSHQTMLQAGSSASWMAPGAQGRLELFAHGSDGALWHVWQQAVNGGWSGWYSHGSPSGVVLGGSPIVGRNVDGRLQVFVRGNEGNLWSVTQSSPGGGWGGWISLGRPQAVGVTDSASVAANSDGRLEIFAQGVDQNLYHIWQTTPGGSWSGWDSRASPLGGIEGVLSIATSQDGRMEVFAVGNDGALWHIWQLSVNGGWSNWFNHGTPSGETFAGSGIPPMTAAQSDGRIQLFIPSASGKMWRISQTTINGGWTGFVSHGSPGSPSKLFTDPGAIVAQADGTLVFTMPAQGGIYQISQTKPSGDWSGWSLQVPSGSGPEPTDGSVALAQNADGRLELAMLGSDRAIWHVWQPQRNSPWSQPATFGKPANVQFQANR